MTRVCDIRAAGTLDDLRALAVRHHARLLYLGRTLTDLPVYCVLHEGVEWVAVGTDRDNHPVPVTWHSPFERTPRDVPCSPQTGRLRRLGHPRVAR